MHHRTLTPINACTNSLGAVCFDDVNCCTAELPKITADTLQVDHVIHDSIFILLKK